MSVDETDIRPDMEVISSDGQRVGVVDGVEGGEIRLTRYGSASAGLRHYIPLAWVKAVGLAVHLDRPCDEAQREWRVAPAGEGG